MILYVFTTSKHRGFKDIINMVYTNHSKKLRQENYWSPCIK